MTTLDIRPSAPPFSPLSPPGSSVTSAGGVVGTLGDIATSRWAAPGKGHHPSQHRPTARPTPPPRGMNGAAGRASRRPQQGGTVWGGGGPTYRAEGRMILLSRACSSTLADQ